MKTQEYSQMDLFEGLLTPEGVNFEKILVLQEQQDNLRRGLFRRYGDHEKRINEISENMKLLLEILPGIKNGSFT